MRKLLYLSVMILGMLVCASVAYRAVYREGLSAIAYNPIVLFSLYFLLIHFCVPLVKYSVGIFRYQSNYDYLTHLYIGLQSLIAFFFAWVSNYYFKKKKSSSIEGSCVVGIKSGYYLGFFLTIVGIVFSYNDLLLINLAVGGAEEFLSDRHFVSEERGGLRVFSNFLLIGPALMLAACLNSNFSKFFWVFYISSTLYSLCAYESKITLKKMLPFIFAGLSVFFVAYLTTIERYGVKDSDYMQERKDHALYYMLDGAFGNDEARLWFVENGQKVNLGVTYIAAVLNFVPRNWWPEKPLGAGPRLINQIRPGSYVIGQRGNSSLTTGWVVEAQMNFYFAGVLLVMVLWGFFANFLVKVSDACRNIGLKLFFLVSSIFLSSVFMYGEFLGSLTRLLFVGAPLVLVAFYSSFFSIGRRV